MRLQDFVSRLEVAWHSCRLSVLALLLASSHVWAQAPKVLGPPAPPNFQQPTAERGEPVEDDPTERRKWMRERFGGSPGDFKEMRLRAYQLQLDLRARGIQPASPPPSWTSIGPANADFSTNGVTLNVVDSGRVRTILPHPTDVNTVYVLSSGGGLWKTANFTQTNPTWVPKTDALVTTGGGSVAFGRTPNILYLGLGDPFDDFPLAGGFMVKSTDGGDTWSAPFNLAGATSVRDVKVDTSGPNDIVMVATDAGFFRSIDNGVTYDATPNASFGGNALWSLARTSAGWMATAVDGSDNGFIYRSMDQGATWTNTAAGGGRITFGVGVPGDSVVYAFAATAGNTTQLDLYRSIDGGVTLTALNITGKTPTNPNADQGNMNLMDGQAWYNQMILVDPTDATRNTTYIGGNLSTARTTDGGNTWTLTTNWLPRGPITLPYVHADFHAAAVSTLTNPAKLFFGCDGGLFVSNDSGATWDDKKNVGLVNDLVFALTSNPTSPDSVIIGIQDNGTRVRKTNTTTFNATKGGDGFGVGSTQANADWTLGTYVHGSISHSSDVGLTWTLANSGIDTSTAESYFYTTIANPSAPAEDPTGTGVFYTATRHHTYETSDATNWSSIGTSGSGGISAATVILGKPHAVGVSPVDTNHVGVAANNGGFPILLLTTDGGTTWTERNLFNLVPPGSTIGFQPDIANVAWASNSLIYVSSEAPFANSLRVAKSADGGTTWSAANGSLPDVSVTKLFVDPRDATGNTVFAATFAGVYQTTDGGTSWQQFGAGLPNVHVTDIYMPPNGKFIRISTYGRGVWEINFSPAASPPTISKSFGVASIPLAGAASLSFTINNPNASTALTGIGFSDTLPAGLVISTPNGSTGSCGGGTITATQGTNVISLSGATLAASTSCTFSMNVTGTAAGDQNNITGAVISTEGGTGGTASASIKVVAPPSIVKAFNPSVVALNATSSLSFTITNPPANTAALSGLGFTDTLPTGLTVATSSATVCGGTLTTTAPTGIALTGAAVAISSTCQFSVIVTGAVAGNYTNTTGAVTSTNGGTGNTASANLKVAAPPTISKAFGLATVPLNGSVSLTFTITNPNPSVTLNGIGFTDNLPAGLAATVSSFSNTCAAPFSGTNSSTIMISSGSLAPSASCTVSGNVTGTIVGVQNNSVTINSSTSGTGNASNASVTVVAPPTISKVFGVASIPLAGTTSLSFTISNPNASTALTGISFSDPLPTDLVISSPNGLTGSCGGGTITATQGTNVITLLGATLAASASCTFSINVFGRAAGNQKNTTGAVTSTEGGTGGTASASINVVAPPEFQKTFNPTVIALGANSSLTFIITNPPNTAALTGVGFTDTLPTGLTVATSSATPCGGTLTTTAPTGIALAGATLAINSNCVFGVTVTGASLGSYTNITGAVTSNNGGTGNTALANLQVVADPPITGSGRNIHMFRGNPQVIVASFTDGDLTENGTNLAASIDWGDGTAVTQGTVVRVGTTNVFNVVSSHVYSRKGAFSVTVTMTDAQGQIAVAHSTVRFFPINSSH